MKYKLLTLLAITLLVLYYAFYHWLVPPQCISPNQLRFLIEFDNVDVHTAPHGRQYIPNLIIALLCNVFK